MRGNKMSLRYQGDDFWHIQYWSSFYLLWEKICKENMHHKWILETKTSGLAGLLEEVLKTGRELRFKHTFKKPTNPRCFSFILFSGRLRTSYRFIAPQFIICTGWKRSSEINISRYRPFMLRLDLSSTSALTSHLMKTMERIILDLLCHLVHPVLFSMQFTILILCTFKVFECLQVFRIHYRLHFGHTSTSAGNHFTLH